MDPHSGPPLTSALRFPEGRLLEGWYLQRDIWESLWLVSRVKLRDADYQY